MNKTFVLNSINRYEESLPLFEIVHVFGQGYAWKSNKSSCLLNTCHFLLGDPFYFVRWSHARSATHVRKVLFSSLIIGNINVTMMFRDKANLKSANIFTIINREIWNCIHHSSFRNTIFYLRSKCVTRALHSRGTWNWVVRDSCVSTEAPTTLNVGSTQYVAWRLRGRLKGLLLVVSKLVPTLSQ